MNVNIIRGTNQIGGNIIEISTSKAKILLDIGMEIESGSGENNSDSSIFHLLNENDYDGVFVSHYHLDHVGLAYEPKIKKIPLYLGEYSYKIISAYDKYRRKDTISPAGFLYHNKTICIKDIRVTPFLCDHSAFDSYMFLCESDNEKVLYTGDFRSNGRKSYKHLLKQLPRNVDKLICEGTTLSRKDYLAETEDELEGKMVNMIKNYSGPIFILQSSTNIDRIVTSYRAAKRSRRVFLQELLMAQISSSIGGSIPNPEFNDVFVFSTNPQRYDELCEYESRVGKNFIKKSSFVMCIRGSMIRYLKALSKEVDFSKGLLIYSLWEGYKKDELMSNFLKECEGLGLDIIDIHTSGHADRNAILELINTVQPREIIPVHTLLPEWFDSISCNNNEC